MYSFIHSYIYVFCLHRYLFKFNFEQFLPGGVGGLGGGSIHHWCSCKWSSV